MSKIKIKEITRTCESCPAQWEGKTDDGRMIYVRYRWGHLSIRISPEQTDYVSDAVRGEEILSQQIGDDLHGFLTIEELKTATAEILVFPQ